jgi:ribosome-associated protein YbcJ (S4-like RNA binding protein)
MKDKKGKHVTLRGGQEREGESKKRKLKKVNMGDVISIQE